MSSEPITVSRPLVGVLTVACAVIGGVLYWNQPEGTTDNIVPHGFLRVSLLLAALWIALPSKGREAAWARVTPGNLLGGCLMLVLVAIRPKIALLALVVLVVAAFFLRPRQSRRPPRNF